MPGGVDTHAHIEQTRELGGPLSVGELFDTGGLSALCGGTTTTLSFCQQMAGVPLATAIADYRAKSAKATTVWQLRHHFGSISYAFLSSMPPDTSRVRTCDALCLVSMRVAC